MTKTKAAVHGGMSSEAFRTLEYSNFEFVSSFGFFSEEKKRPEKISRTSPYFKVLDTILK
jgi:hypothetical protein